MPLPLEINVSSYHFSVSYDLSDFLIDRSSLVFNGKSWFRMSGQVSLSIKNSRFWAFFPSSHIVYRMLVGHVVSELYILYRFDMKSSDVNTRNSSFGYVFVYSYAYFHSLLHIGFVINSTDVRVINSYSMHCPEGTG
jgi:hypothetical protein